MIDESSLKNPSIRIRFDKGETGWAENLGNGKYRLANIPLANDLNIDDVVTCEEGDDGWLEIIDVVERRFSGKTAVKYEEVDQYYALRKVAKEAGFKVEGLFGPMEMHLGYA